MADFESFQELNRALNNVVPATAQSLLSNLNDLYNSELSKLVNVAGAYARDYVTIQRLGTDSTGNVVDQTTSNGQHIANQQIIRHQADIKSLMSRQELVEKQVSEIINFNNVKRDVNLAFIATGNCHITNQSIETDDNGNTTIQFRTVFQEGARMALFRDQANYQYGQLSIGPSTIITTDLGVYNVLCHKDYAFSDTLTQAEYHVSVGRKDGSSVSTGSVTMPKANNPSYRISMVLNEAGDVTSLSFDDNVLELEEIDPLTLNGISNYPDVSTGAWVKSSNNPYVLALFRNRVGQKTFTPGSYTYVKPTSSYMMGYTNASGTYAEVYAKIDNYSIVFGHTPAIGIDSISFTDAQIPVVDVWSYLVPTLKPSGLLEACNALIDMQVD